MKPELAQAFAEVFASGAPNHFVADFAHATKDEKTGKLLPIYDGRPGRPTVREFQAHIDGRIGILIVPVDDKGLCSFGAIDIDVYPVDFEALGRKIKRLELPLQMCRTKSGGAHLYYFCSPRSAAELIKLLKKWARLLGYKNLEIFPKQERLEPGDSGNGINLPYLGRAKNVAVGAHGDVAIAEFIKASVQARSEAEEDEECERAAQILSRYWTDKRHLLALTVAGALLRHDCDRGRVLHLITRTANLAGDEEIKERRSCVAEAEKAIRNNRKMYGVPELIERIGREATDDVLDAFDVKQQEEIAPLPTSLVVAVGTFNQQELPKREALIPGLLMTQTLSMIFAARGLGKTMLALYMAVQLASGNKVAFLKWSVPEACRVLFIDGEMVAAELQERLRKFCGATPPALLDVLASEAFYASQGHSLNLASVPQQARILVLLDALEAEARQPRVIFLDNKSALSAGTDENSNSEQDSFLGFLRELRHRGYAVVLVHHAGKNGDQRGASRTEDFLDLVIRLEAPSGAEAEDSDARGAAFKLTFTKHRGLRPDPRELNLQLIEDAQGKFDWSISRPPRKHNWLRVAEYIRDHKPKTQVEIGNALGMDKSDVSEHVKKLRDKKMLLPATPPIHLSESGLAYMRAVASNAGRVADPDIEGA